jgi:hypothetical protein
MGTASYAANWFDCKVTGANGESEGILPIDGVVDVLCDEVMPLVKSLSVGPVGALSASTEAELALNMNNATKNSAGMRCFIFFISMLLFFRKLQNRSLMTRPPSINPNYMNIILSLSFLQAYYTEILLEIFLTPT